MAQSTGSGGMFMFAVGDYVVEKQIGSGSFSTVWHARHRVRGTEVAIKEIVTARLNSNLQNNLKSEIVILKKIDHPNIIRLHDMIEESGKIYIILEYCRGGDLSVYIRKWQGRIPEPIVKHFMHQLASGLKVLRENNLIHRDLKPQNLLLSSSEDKSVLKIADFGFARSLQPRGLAETLCGSPLYMAPEIMQLQKYDAKADLWSVGAILYQLLIGKTPYTGSNQMQLLQNIVKTELQFPPDAKYLSPLCIDLCRKLLRRNPVERLTFEEFFNHPFFSQRLPDELSWNMTSHRVINGFPLSQANPVRHVEENFQEDCLPFSLDDDCCGPDGTPSFVRRAPLTPSFREVPKSQLKVEDSLELIYLDYVVVSRPTLDVSSMLNTCKLSNLQSKSGSPLELHGSLNHTSAPMPIVGTAAGRVNHFEMFESCWGAPGILPGSLDMKDAPEQRSSDSMTRIRTLERCVSCISELVFEKIKANKHLEAFSLQLVIISIRKEILHICHMHSASGIEGSSTLHELTDLTDKKASLNIQKLLGASGARASQDLCSQIEKTFLLEIGHAEELAKAIEPGNTEMPDAMEAIFQFALAFGRRGGVDEYMGNTDGAVMCYSKAVNLFQFILVEAPIILNPPFSLSNSDRLRLENYVEVLNSRQSISRSERYGPSEELKSPDVPGETVRNN